MSEEYGIGSHGFNVPSMSVIKADVAKAYQDRFGTTINVNDASHFGQQIDIQAYAENRIWQNMQMVYNSQTVSGAEDVFLDEVFAKQNIWRNGKQAGSGEVVIETDKRANYTDVLGVDIEYQGSNSIKYKSSQDTSIGSSVIAYKLSIRDLEVKTYEFQHVDTTDGSSESTTIQLSSTNPINVQNFFKEVIEFFKTVVNVDESLIQNDELNNVLYIGFTTRLELVGISQTIGLNVQPMIGNRFTQLTTVATEKGYFPLAADQITGMSRLPIGFVRVTNILPFSSGADVETDAAFRASAALRSERSATCTRPAMVAGMLKVPDVSKVKFKKEVSREGVVKVTPVILGGDLAAIAETLYALQPIDCTFEGSVSYPVTTEDGDLEVVRFDRGVVTPCDIKVTYKVQNTLGLSSSETARAVQNLLNLSTQFQIGSKVFNAPLKSAVFDSTTYGRFTDLRVFIKRHSEDESAYTEQDFIPLSTELPSILEDDITFTQEVS